MKINTMLIAACSILFLLSVVSAEIFDSPSSYEPYYSPPYDVYSGNEVVFNLSQDSFPRTSSEVNIDVKVSQSNRFIWKTGYYYNESSPINWTPFTLKGNSVKYQNGSDTNWIFNTASKSLKLDETGFRRNAQNLIITYSCKKYEGEWKCGCVDDSGRKCGYWGLQVFSVGEAAVEYNGTSIPIFDCQGLQNMSANLGGDYILLNDVDCSMTQSWNGGKGFEPIGNTGALQRSFFGSLDGAGKAIHNLTINRPNESSIGLMGSCSGCEIGNLSLVNLKIKGDSLVGGLVGSATSSLSISNVYVSGVVSGNSSVGGVVGSLFRSSLLSNSFSNVSTYGDSFVGGLVGIIAQTGTILSSFSVGPVYGNSRVGGVLGSDAGGGTVVDECGWYNGSGGDAIVGVGYGLSIDYEISNISYFFNASNAPMNTWDFNNTWQENPGSYPTLRGFD